MELPSRRHHFPLRLATPGLAVLLVFGDCGSDGDELGSPSLPATNYDYATLSLPAHFEHAHDFSPSSNPVTNAGATLGRVLFYDKHLSGNNKAACASCHNQALAFTVATAKGVGFEGGQTKRNPISLVNLRFHTPGFHASGAALDEDEVELLENYGLTYADGFFSDLRADSLEQLALMPIEDPVELGMSLAQLPGKLQKLSYYPQLFRDAFGDEQVTTDRVARALAQFLRSIVSTGSKLDEGLEQGGHIYEELPNLSAQENLGRSVFVEHGCVFCHSTFSAGSFAANNGLDATTTDVGVGGFRTSTEPQTGRNRLDGFFKPPTLRNIELTAPYMHDGRFATLEQVVEHYNSGVQAHPNLTEILKVQGAPKNGPPQRLNLSPDEKGGLVAFLKTMTDRTLLSDPKFSDPF